MIMTVTKRSGSRGLGLLLYAGTVLLAGCASTVEKAARDRYSQAETGRFEIPDGSAPSGAGLPVIDGKAGIDEYLRYAFMKNPALSASFSRWRAALERIPQERLPDDPELSYEYSLDQKDFLQRFALVQPIPGIGKLGLSGSRAAFEAEAAGHEFEAGRIMVYGEVVAAFNEYNYLRRATEVTEETLVLLTNLEKVVRTSYETGTAAFADMIKVQVEQERMNSELAALQDERMARSEKLASLLGLTTKDELPWPVFVPSEQGSLPVDGLMMLLRDLNPELKAMDAEVQAAEAGLKLARRSRFPDFMVGVSLMTMPGMAGEADETEAGLMAGITLPVWVGRNSASAKEAGALVEAAKKERDNLENSLKADLKMAIYQAKDAGRRVSLFSGSLIPKARQAYESARQEFSAGKVDFMTLIDAHRTLLEFRLMHERALADAEIAMAEIGCCIGKYSLSLTETQDGEADR